MYCSTPATRSAESTPLSTLSLKNCRASCWICFLPEAMRAAGKSDVGQLARRGVVVRGAVGIGEFLGEDALGRRDDEARDLGAGIGEHFLVLELDGLLRLGEE